MRGGRRNCCKVGVVVGLGVRLPNLTSMMMRKQSKLCREPAAARELSLPGEEKLPRITAPESVAKPVREAATM